MQVWCTCGAGQVLVVFLSKKSTALDDKKQPNDKQSKRESSMKQGQDKQVPHNRLQTNVLSAHEPRGDQRTSRSKAIAAVVAQVFLLIGLLGGVLVASSAPAGADVTPLSYKSEDCRTLTPKGSGVRPVEVRAKVCWERLCFYGCYLRICATNLSGSMHLRTLRLELDHIGEDPRHITEVRLGQWRTGQKVCQWSTKGITKINVSACKHNWRQSFNCGYDRWWRPS